MLLLNRYAYSLIAVLLTIGVPEALIAQGSITLHLVDVQFVQPEGEVMLIRFSADQTNTWDAKYNQRFQITGLSYSYGVSPDVLASAALITEFPTIVNTRRAAAVSPVGGLSDEAKTSGPPREPCRFSGESHRPR